MRGALLLALLLLGKTVDAAAGLAFGARTQIWPFLYGEPTPAHGAASADELLKADIASGNLDRYADLGATWNIVDAWQELDGPDGLRRLERVVADHERRGLQVALRLLERPEIYDSLRAGGAARDQALAEYRAWLEQVARRFGSRVRYYMISNEADHDIGWNRPFYRAFRAVEFDEYRVLLASAHATLKAVDSRLVVADHGVSSYSLCVALIADRAWSGRPAEALELWRRMAYRSPDEGARTMGRLVRMLARADTRHRADFARRSVAELGPLRDVFQLHHYFGPELLPELLDWLDAQMRRGHGPQPIVAAEIGYRVAARTGTSWDGSPAEVADMSSYSPGDHVVALARMVAILGGRGIEDLLYWQIRFHHARGVEATLFEPAERRDEFTPRPAAAAFSFLARELAGSRAVAASAALEVGGLVEFRFRGDAGDRSLVWANGAAGVFLPPGARAAVAGVARVDGTLLGQDDWKGRVGAEPLLVYWRADPVGT
jgi:hypothetical protein